MDNNDIRMSSMYAETRVLWDFWSKVGTKGTTPRDLDPFWPFRSQHQLPVTNFSLLRTTTFWI